MNSKDLRSSVLVTGAAGVIGRRLVPALLASGYKVVCIDRQGMRGVFGPEVKLVSGDLADQSFCNSLDFSSDKLSAIIHLAGLADVATAEADPNLAYEINFGMTENLLKLVVKFDINRFLFASTGLVYDRENAAPVHESAPTNPTSVYANSKLNAERLIFKFTQEYNLSAEILRFSNVYGPESSEKTVLGRILAQIRNKKPIEVASVLPVRDFIFIDDVVMAILKMLTSVPESKFEITNISTGVGTSIGEIVAIAKRLSGEDGSTSRQPENPLADKFILSNEKLWKRTGWRPEVSITEGLRLSLEAFINKECV